MCPDKKAWADPLQRFRARVNKMPKIVIGLGAFVAAVVGLGAAAIYVYDFYEKHADWRDHEYDTLRSLHAGYTRKAFSAKLGQPVFDVRSDNGKFREETYRGRGYWVQAISDDSGTVVVYSVTACDERFKPTFHNPATGEPVTLNKTLLDGPGRHDDAAWLDYYLPGATGNAWVHDFYYGGNPGNYQTTVVGLNDACPDTFRKRVNGAAKAAGVKDRFYLGYRSKDVYADQIPKAIRGARRRMVANLYGESAAKFGIGAEDFQEEKLGRAFQIGSDRIRTRVTER